MYEMKNVWNKFKKRRRLILVFMIYTAYLNYAGVIKNYDRHYVSVM